ncbi:hypothetical protein [Galbibacter pacificus]|uniref:Uncharacterized protein n=1 Tax=Galbibacter pacificus TaxID=2996052 RepID=A0ABT6FQH4_9FLAO|nr:hypothetical protein [Galbibacter pacificus]MDG3582051.1 hypothetical protein [Galbibacter pacificus]MDG3585475.1 hypothetical protein [Galbibacter pacificus]
MACLITAGRTEPCKDSLGGIRAAYFINYVEDPFTITDGEAIAINVDVTEAFKYELRADGNNFAQNKVSDRNTGTNVNTQTLTLALKQLDKETSLQVDLMSKGRPIIVIEDYNGNFQAAGISEGMDLTGTDINSGGAKTDFNGYNLTLTAMEKDLAPFLDESTITALKALV